MFEVGDTVLEVSDLAIGYHGGLVLKGVDLSVRPGEIVALLGRNGVGKSTLVYTIAGLLRPSSGSVLIGDWEAVGKAPHLIAQQGVGLVPQGRRIWAGLTVDEHLRVSASAKGPWSIERVIEMFPRLQERRRSRADTLSGGEQQMLALARALVGNPRLLLLDEPSEGLAPKIVANIGSIARDLANEGMAILLVEQNLGMVQDASDRVAVLDRGVVAYSDSLDSFRQRPDLGARLLGVGAEEVA